MAPEQKKIPGGLTSRVQVAHHEYMEIAVGNKSRELLELLALKGTLKPSEIVLVSGGSICRNSLGPMLRRLRESGLVARQAGPPARRGGHPEARYRITARGAQIVDLSLTAMGVLQAEIFRLEDALRRMRAALPEGDLQHCRPPFDAMVGLYYDFRTQRDELLRLAAEQGDTRPAPDRADEGRASRGDGLRFFRDAPIGLSYLDQDLRFVRINEWLARLNGLSVEQHLGRTVAEVLPDVAVRLGSQLRHVLETGEPIVDGLVKIMTPDHPTTLRTYAHNIFPDRSPDGAVIGICCAVGRLPEDRPMVLSS